jgi:hypothetical protein
MLPKVVIYIDFINEKLDTTQIGKDYHFSYHFFNFNILHR